MLKSEEQIHAQKLWEHLDNLAENNPEEYKKFIEAQMKNGIDAIKTENTDKKNYGNKNANNSVQGEVFNFTKDEVMLNKLFNNKKENIKSQPSICLRFKILKFIETKPESKMEDIIIKSNQVSSDINEVQKIVFSLQFTSDALSNKIIQDPKVYLNVVYSEDFYQPINSLNKPENSIEKWNYIPTSFRPSGIKKSLRGIKCLIYDCLIHTSVAKALNTDDKTKSQILSYISRKFNIFLNCYCELYLKNVKILENHKYKGLTALPHIWNIDSKGDSISIKETSQPKKEDKDSKEEIKFKNFHEENKIKIPSISENYPGTDTFYNKPKENNKSSTTKTKEEKKVLIQEVTSKPEIKLESKRILDLEKMELVFSFSSFNNITMNDIDLQISKNELKVLIENMDVKSYKPIYFNFEGKFELDDDYCEAKFNPKDKQLKIIIKKIN